MISTVGICISGGVKYSSVGCQQVGELCGGNGRRSCCPPHECKMLNPREGICVRVGGDGQCLGAKYPCRNDGECCSRSCVNGSCSSK